MNKRRLDVEHLWRVKRVGDPAISLAGDAAIVPVTTFDMQKNDSVTHLWRFDTRSGRGRQLTFGNVKDAEPTFSPDGKSLAFVSKRDGSDITQLYVLALDGGEARQIGDVPTGAFAIRWFPDGKRIAFLSWVWPDLATLAQQGKRLAERKASKIKAHVVENDVYRHWDQWLSDGRVLRLFEMSLASGRARDLTAKLSWPLMAFDPDSWLYDIAPDGKRAAVRVCLDPALKLTEPTEIVEIDLASLRATRVNADAGRHEHSPRYSPDGKWLAWCSCEFRKSFFNPDQLMVQDRKRGAIRSLTPALDRAVQHPVWTADSSALLFLAESEARVPLFRVALAGGARQKLVEDGTLTGFALARDGTLAYTRATLADPPRLFAWREGNARALDHFNDTLLKPLKLGASESITVRGWRREPVQAWVVYPPDFDAKKKWPLLHVIHGGPHSSWTDTWHGRWNMHAFAAMGFVCVGVNYHGSSGWGDAFQESIRFNYGEKEFADVEAVTDALVKRGFIDRDRLAASGGSYGGFMVAWMNGHTDRYKAYVCHAGCFDWVSMTATDGYYFWKTELGAHFWEDEALLHRQSPRAYTAKMKTPTLVIHGELDYRVPAEQGLFYFNALRTRGVASRLVYFPDENHWILKPQNGRLWYREFEAWLKRFVKPGGVKRA